MIYYFKEVFPVKIIHFKGTNLYYFKLRHLAKAFDVPFAKAAAVVPKIKFKTVKDNFPMCDETMYPTTLLVDFIGLELFSRCLSERDEESLRRFISTCLGRNLSSSYKFVEEPYEDDDYEEEVQENQAQYEFGVLSENIEFVKLNQKCYFKAFDVATAIGCSPSYNINRHVSDSNMILWVDLRRYISHKCRASIPNKWKDQTVFLKRSGLRQLLLYKNQKALYGRINMNVAHYDAQTPACYKKQATRYRKKQLFAQDCVVGKLFQQIDFVMTPDKRVWLKLTPFLKHYKLKKVDLLDYEQHITSWYHIEKRLSCNIRWKHCTMLVDDVAAYKILKKFDLNSEAENFYFHYIYNIRRGEKLQVKN